MKIILNRGSMIFLRYFVLFLFAVTASFAIYTLSQRYFVNAQESESNAISDEILTTSNSNKYTIFTKDDCEFCDEIKTELKDLGITNVEYINVSDNTENETAFVNILNKCGLETGSVPLSLIDGKCISGLDNLLLVIEVKEDSKAYVEDAKEFVAATDVIVTTILPEDWAVHPAALNVSDYIIFAFFAILLILSLVFAFRANYTKNEKMRMISVIIGFVLILGLAGYLGFRVNQAGSLGNFLSSAGKKKGNDCIATNSCRDWNERMDAQVQRAKDSGNKADVEKFESKKVDQAALDAQLNAIAAACQANAACKASLDTSGGIGTTGIDTSACSTNPNSEDCKNAIAKHQANLYGVGADGKPLNGATYWSGRDKTEASLDAEGEPILTNNGKLVDAIIIKNYKDLEETKRKFRDNLIDRGVAGKITCTADPTSENCRAFLKQMQEIGFCPISPNVSVSDCTLSESDITAEKSKDIFYKTFTVTQNSQTGLNEYNLNREMASTDECLVPTSGGACPPGTLTCICQETPVYRATCAVPGQNCYSVCIATHNICEDCGTPEEPPYSPPESELRCGDGIINNSPQAPEQCEVGDPSGVSCPWSACNRNTCKCNAVQPICGDGIINQSPQAPEQCEAGDPAGTSCTWATCNQTTCRCPITNPNYSILKTHSVVCVYPTPSTIAARVTYNISLTYTNPTSPATPGAIERVRDDPIGVPSSWVVPGSINLGGQIVAGTPSVSNFGILWDLVPPESVFTIPSGQTSVTKSNLLTYQIQIPSQNLNTGLDLAEGSYINLATAYPSQTTTDGAVSYTDSVYVYCSIRTSIFDSTIAKFALAIFLIVVAFAYFFSNKVEGTLKPLAKIDIASKMKGLVDAKQYRKNKKEDFESKIIAKREK